MDQGSLNSFLCPHLTPFPVLGPHPHLSILKKCDPDLALLGTLY